MIRITEEAKQYFRKSPVAVTIADPLKEDVPLIFANDRFSEITLYKEDEVIGKNCRFLQSENTDIKEKSRIRNAVFRAGICVSILENVKKDGQIFDNFLILIPGKMDNNSILMGFQFDFSEHPQIRAIKEHISILHKEIYTSSNPDKYVWNVLKDCMLMQSDSAFLKMKSKLLIEKIEESNSILEGVYSQDKNRSTF